MLLQVRKLKIVNFELHYIYIIGITLVFIGLLLLIKDNFEMNVIKNKGIVETVYLTNTENAVVLSITYEFNNEVYRTNVLNYKREIHSGEKIIIYHDLFSLENVNTKLSFSNGYLIAIIGIIILYYYTRLMK